MKKTTSSSTWAVFIFTVLFLGFAIVCATKYEEHMMPIIFGTILGLLAIISGVLAGKASAKGEPLKEYDIKPGSHVKIIKKLQVFRKTEYEHPHVLYGVYLVEDKCYAQLDVSDDVVFEEGITYLCNDEDREIFWTKKV